MMRRLAFRLVILFVILLQVPFVSAIAIGGEPPATINVTTPDASGNYVVSWTPPSLFDLSSATRVPIGLISFAGVIPTLSSYVYRLYEQKDGGLWVTLRHDLPGLSHSISSQTTGSYKYKVRACTFFQCSPEKFSNTVVVGTSPPPPPPPDPSPVINYKYDALGRLIEVKDPGNGDRAYDYDAAGNRTTLEVNP